MIPLQTAISLLPLFPLQWTSLNMELSNERSRSFISRALKRIQATSQNRSSNIYKYSKALDILKKNLKEDKKLRLAFLDIDSTMTGNKETTNLVRRALTTLGYVVIFVTSRTEEMLMTKRAYQSSLSLGFSRPQPKLGKLKNQRYYLPPEEVEPWGILDPEIIAGASGTKILVAQLLGGYKEDKNYAEHLYESPDKWKKEVLKILKILDPQKRLFITSVDKDKSLAN